MTFKYSPNCSQFEKSRRTVSFPVFANNTDEKNQTIKIMGSFLDDYLPGLIANLISCDIVDLGCGNGDLPYKVAKYMNAVCHKKIIYHGIEKEEEFVNQTKEKLLTLEVVDSQLVQGDCFGEEIDKLVNNPVLLISSQVIFYLNGSFDLYIKRIIQKTGLVAIIIAQADGSYLNKVGQSYGDPLKRTETENLLYNTLTTHTNFSHIKILYSSLIYFPKSVTYEKMIEIASSDFATIDPSSQDYKTRALLEFIAGRKLEYLNCTNELSHFIGDTYTNIQKNANNARYWNYMTITVPKTYMNQEDMKKEWQKAQRLKLSGNITSFEAAIEEGNYEISYALFKQGIVTCELRNNYHYSFIKEKLNMITSYLRYELKLSLGWQEMLKFLFNFELDEREGFRVYKSLEILKMQSIKYNYSVIYHLPDAASEAKVCADSKGNLFRGWLSKEFGKSNFMNHFSSIVLYPAIFEAAYLAPLVITSIFIPDKIAQYELAIGLSLIYNSFWKKFFYTSNSAVHYIKGDDFLLQLYLFDEKYYDSLKFQNSEGQTTLHKAILTSDTDNAKKVDNLLSCSKSIVDSIINIKDVRGQSALHEAAYQGNLQIIKNLLQKGADINASKAPSLLSLGFDLLFLSGKIIYLHGYFTSWVKTHNPTDFGIYKKTITLGILSVIYFTSDILNAKLPDTIYYFAFLHRLNSYDDWDGLNNISRIYLDYDYDTALHISTKKNYTDIAKYLITHHDMSINALNAKGESALHFAAANNNYELLTLLLGFEHNATSGGNYSAISLMKQKIDINHQESGWQLYKLLDYLIKSILLYLGSNGLFKTFSEILFLKVINDEIFSSSHAINSATPLHYAIGGMSLSETNVEMRSLYKVYEEKPKLMDIPGEQIRKTCEGHRSILYLIQKGADLELTMSYHHDFLVEMMPYVFTKAISIFLPISKSLQIAIFLLSQILLSCNKIALRPIDLIQQNLAQQNLNIDCEYDALKQFTVLNFYHDVNRLSLLDPRYFLYKLKFITDNDQIYMKDYGMYKGGSGRDIFYVYCNFLGKNDGKLLIIKDYRTDEDKIIFLNCGNNHHIDYKLDILNTKLSTILYFNEAENNELVTLLDIHIDNLGEIDFMFE
jgi:ankyrin repeat protein